jgi:D-alanyl-D-alanine carboxypeptidase
MRWPTLFLYVTVKSGAVAGSPELAGFFGTESRHHMLDANYLSAWFPKRAGERRAYLERIVKATPCWLGTPALPPSPW